MQQAVAIFCGSANGSQAIYVEHAELVGRTLAERGITLVYGGGKVGLMGAVANACLQAGGRVIGVMPRHLVEREIVHRGLTELYVVENMHERKNKMAELADGFIALAGGAGTMEEIFEQWTWAQIGLHHKPCAFLNTAGYYDDLFKFIEKMVEQQFTQQRYADMLCLSSNLHEILQHFQDYQAPPAKWQ